MKLRNKKTGKIICMSDWTFCSEINVITLENDSNATQFFEYKSLAEFNEVWEDYEQKEPLIKDEKVRKAVRAWAEANNIQIASFYAFSSSSWYLRAWNDGSQGIDFWLRPDNNPQLIDNRRYTIVELCGEEE